MSSEDCEGDNNVEERKRAVLKKTDELIKEIREARAPEENKVMIRLMVGDSRQRDVGRGIARISQKTMQELGISPGDVIEIVGKRTTSAIAWPAYSEDQNREIIRIDGFTRKNAGVAINEYVIVKPANVKNALNITFAPVGMRLNVDEDFTNFVKNRLMERTLIEGDTTLVMMLGHAIPFTVTKIRPHGIVKVTAETRITILNEPAPEAKGIARIRYTDIGGLDRQIADIRRIIEIPLKHPEVLTKFGMPMFGSKGILLYGPSGCGKTLVAKAVGNESEANFFDVDALELSSGEELVAISRLRELFRQVQLNQPSIVFIDHIEVLAPKEPEKECIKHLVALIDKLRGNVMVLGATESLENLDASLFRAGRFDRKIEIGLPDEKGRYDILKIHSRMMPLGEDIDFKRLAEMTNGYTGAELKRLCDDVSRKALNRQLSKVDLNKPEEEIAKELEKIKGIMEDFIESIKNRHDAA